MTQSTISRQVPQKVIDGNFERNLFIAKKRESCAEYWSIRKTVKRLQIQNLETLEIGNAPETRVTLESSLSMRTLRAH